MRTRRAKWRSRAGGNWWPRQELRSAVRLSADILQRLNGLLPELSKATSCEFTDLDPTFAYATKQPDADLNLGWHCDSGSFYDFGSHDTFLNFYVIVQKSDPQHSNLSFVSWDTLRELDPALPSKLKEAAPVNFKESLASF